MPTRAEVADYRSDMTRTLFVGEPTTRDLQVYDVVAVSQAAAVEAVRASLARAAHGVPLPAGRRIDAVARGSIQADGRRLAFGHGIGLATHELPSLGPRAAETPLPSPTVFSVEPGIYLDGETGVRIEDLVVIDARSGNLDVLTRFPSSIVVVGA